MSRMYTGLMAGVFAGATAISAYAQTQINTNAEYNQSAHVESVSVPEPASFILTGAGMFMLSGRERKDSRRPKPTK